MVHIYPKRWFSQNTNTNILVSPHIVFIRVSYNITMNNVQLQTATYVLDLKIRTPLICCQIDPLNFQLQSS